MPADENMVLIIEVAGWGEKRLTFRSTVEEAKKMAEAMSFLFRENVRMSIQMPADLEVGQPPSR